MTKDDDEAATPQASGGMVETCARCGHTAPTCDRCGEHHLLLGGRVGERDYCHTFVEQGPTCYMLTQWERPREELRASPLTSGLAEVFDKHGLPDLHL